MPQQGPLSLGRGVASMPAPPAPAALPPSPRQSGQPAASTFASLPEDVFPFIVCGLEPRTLGRLAAVSSDFPGFSRSDQVWRSLARTCLWPCDVEILELLCSGRLLLSSLQKGGAEFKSPPLTWRGLFKAHKVASSVLVVDMGFGYTKFGFPPRGLGPPAAPGMLQLCSSPTHPADAPRQRQLRVVLDRASRPGTTSAQQQQQQSRRQATAVLVCEPFGLASEADAAGWREGFVRPQLPPATPCLFCPQPVLALLAHGGHQDGVVLNIGQREVVIAPCLDGKVCRQALRTQEGMGSSMLTQVMLELLVARNAGVDWDMLTWCRDLKEQHCRVALEPLVASSDRDIAAVAADLAPPVEVSKGRVRLQLGAERFMVPEVLFRRGRVSLPWLVMQAVMKAADAAPTDAERRDAAARLLSTVTIVGGTAEIPGLHARLQRELKELLRDPECSRVLRCGDEPPEVKVLIPSADFCSPRTAVLRGGQLAAAAACAGGLVAGITVETRYEVSDLEDIDPAWQASEPHLALCCSAPWRRPTRMHDFREYITAARRNAASTVAALRQMWRSAVGTTP